MRCHYSKSRSWFVAALLLLAPGFLQAADESFDKTIAPFLKQHCHSCHGSKKQEGGVRLDQLEGVQIGNRTLWTMVHEKVASGEMPPKERAQPTEAEKKAVLTWIRDQQRGVGVGGSRRLNRRELSASLRDVTGSRVDFSYALPGDGTVAGFDTGAEGLQEASDAVAQWLQVTRRAVDGIRFLEPANGKVFAANLREVKDARKSLEEWKADGATFKAQGIARPGMGLLIEPRAVGDRDELTFSVPAPADRQGVLRVTVLVSTFKPLDGLPNPRLWVRIGGQDLDFREITGTLDKPQRLVYEVQLGDLVVQSKGVSIALSNKVEVPYAVAGFENEDKSNPKEPVPGGTGLFRPTFDRKTLPIDKQPAPFVVLQSIEIEPTLVIAWPPAEWKANVGEVKDNAESAKRLLGVWMDRAWRRPVTETEQAPS